MHRWAVLHCPEQRYRLMESWGSLHAHLSCSTLINSSSLRSNIPMFKNLSMMLLLHTLLVGTGRGTPTIRTCLALMVSSLSRIRRCLAPPTYRNFSCAASHLNSREEAPMTVIRRARCSSSADTSFADRLASGCRLGNSVLSWRILSYMRWPRTDIERMPGRHRPVQTGRRWSWPYSNASGGVGPMIVCYSFHILLMSVLLSFNMD